MTTPHEDPSVVPRLDSLFKTTNEWLRYAEAKSGALVATPLALAVGLATFVDWSAWPDEWTVGQWYLLFVMAQLVGAACAALVSFLPRTDIGRLVPRGERSDGDNLLYFGHVAKYSPKFLVKAVRALEGLDEEPDSALEHSYAEQAVVNGRIALWKLRCATWAIRLFLAALLTAPAVFLIERYFQEDAK